MAIVALVLGACSDDGTEPEVEVVRTVVLQGDSQTILPRARLLSDIVVVGHNAAGEEVKRSGMPVTWTVRSGDGEVIPVAVTTAANGRARAAWILGADLGEQTLEVVIAGAAPAVLRAQAVEPGPIAFISNRFGARSSEGDLFVTDADGSQAVRLTGHAAADAFALVRWSPMDQSLLYSRQAGLGSSQLFLLDLDGLSETQLTDLPPPDARGIAVGIGDWSPDGERIVFSIKQGQPDCTLSAWNIWVMDRDGSDRNRLTEGCGLGQKNPDWSPDGSRIAFQQNVEIGGGTMGGDQQVMLMDVDGGNLRTLVSPGRVPRWSPDGLQLLYVVGRSVWVINADGTGAEHVWTTPGAVAGMVDWSPDSSEIVVTVFNDPGGSTADIYRYNLADGTAQNLTNTDARDSGVDWRDSH